MYKCKLCGKKYTELTALYNHIESKHKDMIPKDMSVQQYYYYMKTGKMNGNCVMCKQPTNWNSNTGKYNRFCGDPKCKNEYVKIMKSRMIAKYGKSHLLNDPNKQREMLANRKISGTYEWSDGRHETTYTGSYELDFLKTLDEFFDWDPEDITMPSPHTYTYKYEGEDKFYIPDVFIHSLDLEIEIKDGGDNPNNHHKIQEVDKEKERLKDEVMKSQKHFHYIKITNKNYENFFRFLSEIKKEFEKYGDDKKIPRIFKIEDIKGTSLKPVKESFDECLIEATAEETRQTEILARQLKNKLNMYRKSKNNVEYSWNKIGNGKIEFVIKAGSSSNDLKEVFKKVIDIDKHKNIMKMIKVTESYEDIDVIEEGHITKMLKTFINLDDKTYWENDYFLSIKFDLAKNNPEDLKNYILTLIGAAKGYDDFEYIRMVSDKSARAYHNLKIDMNDSNDPYKQFYDWIERGGGMDAEIKDRKDYLKNKARRKKKKQMQQQQKQLHESYIIDRMEESSISIPQMTMYLQNEYEEEMKNYLNTYKKYYNLMLSEQPAAVKHINEDIRKCLLVIDGLASKGVENNLVQFAKDDLGKIVKAAKHGKPVKVYEESMVEDMVNIDDTTNDINSISVQGDNVSISNQVIECKLVYSNPDSKQIFSLMDRDSKLIIENTYVVQRDKVGTHCSVTPYYKDIDETNVVRFQVILNESVYNLEEKLTNGVVITNLHKFDDNEYKFIKESCLKLFGVYPNEIIIK